MKISEAELKATVRRAAVASGLGWGLADDLAGAAATLCAAGRDGAAIALEALEAKAPELRAAPAALDAALSSGAQEALPQTRRPLLEGYAAAAGAGCEEVAPERLVFTAAQPGAPALRKRPETSVDVWRRLTAIASGADVPATDASRTAGAGAGLTDND